MSDMLLQLNDIGNFGSDQVPLVTYGIVGTGTFMAAVVIFRLFDYFFGGLGGGFLGMSSGASSSGRCFRLWIMRTYSSVAAA